MTAGNLGLALKFSRILDQTFGDLLADFRLVIVTGSQALAQSGNFFRGERRYWMTLGILRQTSRGFGSDLRLVVKSTLKSCSSGVNFVPANIGQGFIDQFGAVKGAGIGFCLTIDLSAIEGFLRGKRKALFGCCFLNRACRCSRCDAAKGMLGIDFHQRLL